MSDTSTAPEATQAETPSETGDTDLTAEVEKWKALSKKNEERAKSNAQAARELEEFRRQSMTDTEKAIEEARTQARAEAMTEVGAKVASSELRSAARLAGFDEDQAATLISGLNLASFLTPDGDVDPTLVTQFIDGITPKPSEAPAPLLDLGQGARTTTMALNGDPLLQSVRQKLGI